MDPIAKAARLENRAVLRLAGPDALPFLQGLVSQDMGLVEQNKPAFTALLTPQGKYLLEFFVVPTPQGLLIDCVKEQVTELVKRFAFFKMRSDIALEDTRDQFAVLAFWGGRETPPEVQAAGYPDPRLAALGRRAIVRMERLTHLPLAGSEAEYREHRYALGVAESGQEIESGNATLLEINFDKLNAISWNKGCYMGQELTARMYYRGLVKKRYLPFRFEGVTPDKRLIVRHKGFEIGQVQAVGEEHGIGVFNLEKVRPFVEKQQLLVDGGTTFHVYLPGYMDGGVYEEGRK